MTHQEVRSRFKGLIRVGTQESWVREQTAVSGVMVNGLMPLQHGHGSVVRGRAVKGQGTEIRGEGMLLEAAFPEASATGAAGRFNDAAGTAPKEKVNN